MPVYRRGQIWHYDFTLNGERYRGSTRFRDKKAALDYEEREKQRASLGRSYRSLTSLETVFARWFVARVKHLKSAKAVARRIETVLRIMGPDTLVTDIDTPEIEEAIQLRRLEVKRSHQKTGEAFAVSNSTVNRDMIDSTLRPAFNYARAVLKIPVSVIEWKRLRLPEPKGRVRSFTAKEIEAWRAELPEHHRPIMDFMLRYGVRLTECFFALDDFDPSGRVILRDRKAGDSLALPLLPEDARDFAARAGRAKAAKLDTIWFREVRSRRPDAEPKLVAITWQAFASASKRALTRAGITDARPAHDFRHHAATQTLRAGANLKVVQRLLGHATIVSTARYAHAVEDDVLKALRHAADTSPATSQEKPKKDKAVG